MKITDPSQLRKDDKWLGLTVELVSSPTVLTTCGYEFVFGDVQKLIDAGNNEVEREEGIVTFEARIGSYGPMPNYPGYDLTMYHQDKHVYRFLKGQKDVYVAVSPKLFTPIEGKAVARGEFAINDAGFMIIDGEEPMRYLGLHAKEGCQVLILEGGEA